MRRRAIALVFIALARGSTYLAAQAPADPDPHAVQPERPTVATHAGTVAPGWVEVEAGAEFDHFSNDTRGTSVPVVTKIGLASNLQLSVFGLGTRPPGDPRIGFGDLGIGVKWRFVDEPGVLGRLAVLPSVKVPTGSSESGTGTGTTDISLLLISSHSLGPVSLDINAGYTRRSGTGAVAPRNATLWTISLGGPATGPLGWTAELYGYPATSGPTRVNAIVAVLAGPTMQVRPWLVLDIGGIIPVAGPQPHALYFGGVYNIGRAW